MSGCSFGGDASIRVQRASMGKKKRLNFFLPSPPPTCCFLDTLRIASKQIFTCDLGVSPPLDLPHLGAIWVDMQVAITLKSDTIIKVQPPNLI